MVLVLPSILHENDSKLLTMSNTRESDWTFSNNIFTSHSHFNNSIPDICSFQTCANKERTYSFLTFSLEVNILSTVSLRLYISILQEEEAKWLLSERARHSLSLRLSTCLWTNNLVRSGSSICLHTSGKIKVTTAIFVFSIKMMTEKGKTFWGLYFFNTVSSNLLLSLWGAQLNGREHCPKSSPRKPSGSKSLGYLCRLKFQRGLAFKRLTCGFGDQCLHDKLRQTQTKMSSSVQVQVQSLGRHCLSPETSI